MFTILLTTLFTPILMAGDVNLFCPKILNSYESIIESHEQAFFTYNNFLFISNGLEDSFEIYKDCPKMKENDVRLLVKLKNVAANILIDSVNIVQTPRIFKKHSGRLREILREIDIHLKRADRNPEVTSLFFHVGRNIEDFFDKNVYGLHFSDASQMYKNFLVSTIKTMCDGSRIPEDTIDEKYVTKFTSRLTNTSELHRKFNRFMRCLDVYLKLFRFPDEKRKFYKLGKMIISSFRTPLLQSQEVIYKDTPKSRGRAGIFKRKQGATSERLVKDSKELEKVKLDAVIKIMEELYKYFR